MDEDEGRRGEKGEGEGEYEEGDGDEIERGERGKEMDVGFISLI